MRRMTLIIVGATTLIGGAPGTAHAGVATRTVTDSIRGAVADSAGKPVAGATVVIAELGRASVATADGRFAFADVPAGQYRLIVRSTGFAPAVRALTVPATGAIVVTLRSSSLRLEAVTVTASRGALDPMASPLSSAAVSGDRLRREHEVSLAHALDGLAGVRTLSTGEQTGKPIIRGLTGPRVLVLDDGLRSEDYSWSDEDGPSIDSRLAQRIEVIRGPASVLYGSDAIGGVINVVPDEMPDARGRAGFTRSSAEFYAGTNKADLGGVLRTEGATGALGWRATIIGRRAGNIHAPPGNTDTPTGELFDTDFGAVNGEAALGWHGERASATVRYERYGGNFGILDGPPVADDNLHGPRRKLVDDRIQATTNWVLGAYRVETRSQWQRHVLQEVVGDSRAGLAPPIFDLALNSYSTDVILHHTSADWLSGSIGVSGMYQDNTSTGQVPLVPNARATGVAVFAVEQATSGPWSVLVGARVDSRSLAADANAGLAFVAQRRDASAFTGDVGVVYRPMPELALTANVGRAFRAPTLYELFTNGPHLGEGRWEVGLPEAKPEESLNADVGLRWQGRRVRAEIAIYRNQIDHYLFIQATGDSATFIDPDAGDTTNLPRYRYWQTARAVLRGIDISAEVEALPVLTLRGRFDFVHGVNEQTAEYLPLMPPMRGDVEAELHAGAALGGRRPYVNVGTELVARQTRLGPFDEQTAPYALLHFGGGIEYPVAGRPMMLDLHVRNALNTTYHDFLSRYKTFAYEQGRNLVVRVTMAL